MVAVAQIVSLDGFGKLADIVDSMEGEIDDLRPLWALIANDFYTDETRIFKLKSPGQYDDLADSTKISKQRELGFLYPILRGAERALEGSLTNPSHANAINKLNKKSVVLGSSVEYALYHHVGTKKMPARPLWDENPDGPLMRRWTDTVHAYFEKIFNESAKNPRRSKRTF